MNPIKAFYSYWLKSYSTADFIRQKKAQFLLTMDLLFLLLLIILAGIALTFMDQSRGSQLIIMTFPCAFVTIVSIIFIKQGKELLAGTILSILTALIAVVGFSSRSVLLAGVSLGQFMYICVVFSVLFCNTITASLVFSSMIGAHIWFFIFKTSQLDPAMEMYGAIYETGRSTFLDGIVSLTMVYGISMALLRLLNKAIGMNKKESIKNKEQYNYSMGLLDTIQTTSFNLTNSIDTTGNIITQFSDNARNQAASVEELSATVEEIASSTMNVSEATKEQGNSLANLVDSIHELSQSIDRVKGLGNEISDMFVSFMGMAKQGQESSQTLDEINNKILGNSNQILNVVTIMEDFFERINLLALNASIEAARAGEYGRGFAVVADEIGKLADQSASELKQVNDLIKNNRDDVEEGNKNISNIINFIQQMLSNVNKIQEKTQVTIVEINNQETLKNEMNERTNIVKNKSEQIENTMVEQNNAISDVLKSIDETNEIVQSNVKGTENLKENVDELSQLANHLNEEFKNA